MLLALDLATCTGWCAGSGEGTPEIGAVRMPDTGEEVGPFLSFFRKWLEIKLGEIQPTMVIIEAPILASTTNIWTTRKLQGLAGVAEMVCYDLSLEVREVHLQTVKKALGGSGNASKPDMMAAAKRCGLNPKTFDEADAFGVWIVALREYAKPFAHIWDQRLYSYRAGGGQLT
jgi:Holliday junction resolvasome RuvABC endonuclease subunit